MMEVFLTGGKWSRRAERSQGRSGPFRECFLSKIVSHFGGKMEKIGQRGRGEEGNAEKWIHSENIWEIKLLVLPRDGRVGAELGSTKPSLKDQEDFPSPIFATTPSSWLSGDDPSQRKSRRGKFPSFSKPLGKSCCPGLPNPEEEGGG